MLTSGDDYPIHQAPEPVALVTDRNFYDRYFFNGYSPDGRLFFAAAMGIYPALDVIDAAFCVMIDGVQYNLRASSRLYGERMALTVGPISISIDIALWEITVRVGANDGPLTAELHFAGRHFPIEEPRFTRRIGTRLFMDYTRMTQNGRWSGWLDIAGDRIVIAPDTFGTRDRSWGIRPVGKSDSQPAPFAPQFFWLWTPSNVAGHSIYFHTNDDANGLPWNRRAVIVADGKPRGAGIDFDDPVVTLDWSPGSRRVSRAVIDLAAGSRLTLTPAGSQAASSDGAARGHFYMNGLGYTHPSWGHGMDHGEQAIAHDQIDLATVDDNDPAFMHIQSIADVVLDHGGQHYAGRGIIEQLFIGAHHPNNLTGLFDPVGAA